MTLVVLKITTSYDSTSVSCFCLSAPAELKTSVMDAMKSAECSFDDGDSTLMNAMNRGSILSNGFTVRQVSGLQHHTLLNWIEASGWSLQHMSIKGDSSDEYVYIFKKN
mmetsp:Transcript_4406/g.7701  ORF Transcript_4406/g.7701 Transcript_4406/m.7701 type:complete len:109 (-) Transcript_4406:259-585(-)|eukprot:CAMPEP_0197458466 /NCGR_PEP_ID=MMETSP1175-20131217/48805_1 /TAXON_ID=1003142 /ORGANISM="Triceratium dubium, Strain CCMP147" /LENGTH=108 /DNA_ID=CAMNT_0042993119 /DNA_START=94 /DNA_END=420 /DNA_ORIENTATION=+